MAGAATPAINIHQPIALVSLEPAGLLRIFHSSQVVPAERFGIQTLFAATAVDGC
jgi:hypothetical protein